MSCSITSPQDPRPACIDGFCDELRHREPPPRAAVTPPDRNPGPATHQPRR
ncbi:MAG: hypothetical protein IPP10_02465 [Candidatus Competibacteraceae bacterium]|nr:hypothetical protein [Candidatus Competibacteraceae bacterium]MBK8963517.1 hypothetical protein [Candidatus Competibacteraceae bacterium]MBK9950411.1 hypothetical protein [Candidatus Competibacteraceae bacterium]